LNLDSIRRTSSNNVSVIDDAMKSFGADLPELNMDFPEEKEVYQALAFYNESQGHYFENQYPEFRFVRWHENGVDVVPNNGSKAATLQFLADRVGIKHENVIAFGDGRNDLEMLAKAGIGVAMGNGADYVQAAADMVTDTNERDGIAKALKKLDLI
jgi:Cof subfamily protein (haloacid dehalogenase superfamily)